MITLEKVKDGQLDIGIEINFNGHKYFISADQKEWPGLRTGPYPNKQDYTNTKDVVQFDKEPLYELKQLVKKIENS